MLSTSPPPLDIPKANAHSLQSSVNEDIVFLKKVSELLWKQNAARCKTHPTLGSEGSRTGSARLSVQHPSSREARGARLDTWHWHTQPQPAILTPPLPLHPPPNPKLPPSSLHLLSTPPNTHRVLPPTDPPAPILSQRKSPAVFPVATMF